MNIINSVFNLIPILILVFLASLFLSFVIQFIYISIHEHKKIKKSDTPSTYIRRGILKRLLKDFPEALARDILDRDPDEFPHNGFHCYCGEQGSGKTVALAARLRELKQKYPKVKILSNFDCEFSDGLVKDWKDIVFTENGKHGIIIALDEIQNWFSTNESKDFPPEMIQEICQQRKQHKIIMGTSQRFQRMAKPLREQINFLYEPITFAGCLTFVRKRKPSVDDDGKIDRLKTRKLGTYFFVHDEELRSSYDTWQKILRQANGGYTASPFKQEPAHQNIAIEVSDRRRKL